MQSFHLDDRSCDWFAVQVWAGREAFCATHLRQRGYDVFLPCYKERRRWSDRYKTVERALFTGYLFCRAPEERLPKIVTSPGVIRLVGDGRRPLPVAGDEITTIQRVIDERLSVEPYQHLQTGQRVRLQSGPLRNTEGIVLTVKNGHRLIVSISILQRSVAVEIDSNWLAVDTEQARSPDYEAPVHEQYTGERDSRLYGA